MSGAETKPMLETVLRELQTFRAENNERLERIEIRLDRIESIALEARADVRELRAQKSERRCRHLSNNVRRARVNADTQ